MYMNVGANFFPFVFRFLTYLLSCILFLFALRYFVNYAPLLRAVCKFRYSLLSRPFFLPVYVSISVTALVEVGFSVLGGPDFGIGLCPFNEHQTKVACDLMAYNCQSSCGSQLLI